MIAQAPLGFKDLFIFFFKLKLLGLLILALLKEKLTKYLNLLLILLPKILIDLAKIKLSLTGLCNLVKSKSSLFL